MESLDFLVFLNTEIYPSCLWLVLTYPFHCHRYIPHQPLWQPCFPVPCIQPSFNSSDMLHRMYSWQSLWKRSNLDSSDHTTFFYISSVQSLWSFAIWRHCCLCLGSNSGFPLDIIPLKPAFISLLFIVLEEPMTLFSSFHIFFRRSAVSLQSLIDFNMRLVSSRFEDNLGCPGHGSSVTDLFFMYFFNDVIYCTLWYF